MFTEKIAAFNNFIISLNNSNSISARSTHGMEKILSWIQQRCLND